MLRLPEGERHVVASGSNRWRAVEAMTLDADPATELVDPDETAKGAAALIPAPAEPAARRIDPKYTPILVSTVMAVVMSFTMSLFQTVVRMGLVPGLLSAWLTSFAIGLVVAIPTAIVAAPRAQRLVRYLTGDPRRPKDG
jgi:hypothetical protein